MTTEFLWVPVEAHPLQHEPFGVHPNHCVTPGQTITNCSSTMTPANTVTPQTPVNDVIIPDHSTTNGSTTNGSITNGLITNEWITTTITQ